MRVPILQLLICMFLFCNNAAFAQMDSSEHDLQPTYQERTPSYPDGEGAWVRFVSRSLSLPDSLNPEYSSATVRFLVSKDGTPRHVQMIKGDTALRQTLEQVILNSGKWTPARQGGRAVHAYKTLVINYCLRDE